jgi:AraC-like DNA-binding protein
VARRDPGNTTRYWRSKRLPGMSLLQAEFTTHDYVPHTHDTFVIAVTEVGSAEISNARIVERVGPSTLFVSNPEERQSARIGESKRWSYRSFYLTVSAAEQLAHDLGVKVLPCFARSMLYDADLIRAFGCLHRALETDDDGLRADELLIEAFGGLLGRHGSGNIRFERAPRDKVITDRIIDLMKARHGENIDLQELTAAVGLTSFQLIRLFKRNVGLTPHTYLIHIRLNAACRHLESGHSLAESALAAGFCDQSALTKHLKRWYGITPLQFANAGRLD